MECNNGLTDAKAQESVEFSQRETRRSFRIYPFKETLVLARYSKVLLFFTRGVVPSCFHHNCPYLNIVFLIFKIAIFFGKNYDLRTTFALQL